MEPLHPGQKTCPNCQRAFACGIAKGDETCWCFERPRILPVVENADCLCPDCLQTEIAARLAPNDLTQRPRSESREEGQKE